MARERQHRQQAEAHIGGVNGLEHSERHRARQTLAAISRIGGRGPASRRL